MVSPIGANPYCHDYQLTAVVSPPDVEYKLASFHEIIFCVGGVDYRATIVDQSNYDWKRVSPQLELDTALVIRRSSSALFCVVVGTQDGVKELALDAFASYLRHNKLPHFLQVPTALLKDAMVLVEDKKSESILPTGHVVKLTSEHLDVYYLENAQWKRVCQIPKISMNLTQWEEFYQQAAPTLPVDTAYYIHLVDVNDHLFLLAQEDGIYYSSLSAMLAQPQIRFWDKPIIIPPQTRVIAIASKSMQSFASGVVVREIGDHRLEIYKCNEQGNWYVHLNCSINYEVDLVRDPKQLSIGYHVIKKRTGTWALCHIKKPEAYFNCWVDFQSITQLDNYLFPSRLNNYNGLVYALDATGEKISFFDEECNPKLIVPLAVLPEKKENLNLVDVRLMRNKWVIAIDPADHKKLFFCMITGWKWLQEECSEKIFKYDEDKFLASIPYVDIEAMQPQTIDVVLKGEGLYKTADNKVHHIPVIKSSISSKRSTFIPSTFAKQSYLATALVWTEKEQCFAVLFRNRRGEIVLWPQMANAKEHSTIPASFEPSDFVRALHDTRARLVQRLDTIVEETA